MTAGPDDGSVLMTPLRWGILSTALINTKLLAGAALSSDTEIAAVASRDPGRARAFADRWGIRRAYGSYSDLLADPDVEAVYIPLPNGLHHEWTMRALAAGKHVLCEKPYSRHPEEVGVAFAEAGRRGLVLSEAFMFRYHPQTLAAARLVAAGAIGDLRMVVSSFTWPTDAPGDIRLDPTLDGGSLLDVGVYPLSQARLLAGEPTSVTAQQVLGPTGVDEMFVSTLVFAGGVAAHIDSGFHLPDRSCLEIVGTAGTLVVSDPWHCREPRLTLLGQGGRPDSMPVERANSYQLELEQFARAVRGEPNDLLGREDALGQARAVEALYRSAATGRRVDLLPRREP